MRKAWKIAALLIGVPAILTGWLALDSYSRAVSAIAAHDARLRSEIAAFRSKQTSSPLLQGRDLSPKGLAGVPCPLTALQNLSDHAFETGHTVHDRIYFRYGLLHDSSDHQRFGSLPERIPLEPLITALAVTNAAFPEGGFNVHSARGSMEYQIFTRLAHSLTNRSLDAALLRRISTELDQLMRRRPSLPEILSGEHLLDQVQTLSVLHTRSDPRGWIQRPPGWKEFFSWRILIAKSLSQLEDEYQNLCKLPPSSYPARGDSHRPAENALTNSQLEREAFNLVESEKDDLCYWHLARTATALARFRIEKSRECSDMDELVPEYLSERPVNPVDDKPFQYQGGHLKTAPFYKDGSGIDWDLTPR